MNNIHKGELSTHVGIIFAVSILFLMGAITLFANFMHRSTIKEFEEKGKVYTGAVTDNYFFQARDYGNRSGIRTRYMICFKPSEPIENHELLCSSEYISRSTAQKYPVGSAMSGYFRNDIQDMLLIPGIESWRGNKIFQYLPYAFFGVGIVLLLIGKLKK
ncbi:MAG TPA: hypothetical protein DCS29_01875 [Candidatus Magasanikbacteria bacterium]|nr:MAG: hypothetical protein A2479_01505 [Candidatus Magasanikbacteria bacterium RIFOXYC2_FULL_39_8]HAT03506.1 hypothetical protein [Candidatus Magasanikbacteria bacterium]